LTEFKKDRLDKLLTELGYFETKSKAQSAIMAGDVKINNEKFTKAGQLVKILPDTQIEIKTMPYVSRGGFKLAKAIKEFEIDLNGKICMDAGASTGGFTDCMLQNGAKFVYAVDVGYGQIAWKLRNNEKVKVIERTNIRNCSLQEIFDDENSDKPTFCSIDLSFISLNKVLPNIKTLLSPDNAEILALIKPQFEAGKEQIGKNGVVRSKEVHFEVIKKIIENSEKLDFYPKKLTFSPITGPAGNIEYLIFLTKEKIFQEDDKITCIINEAFAKLHDS